VPRASIAFRIAGAYDGTIHAWRALKRGLRRAAAPIRRR
jgi:hypothetical protein